MDATPKSVLNRVVSVFCCKRSHFFFFLRKKTKVFQPFCELSFKLVQSQDKSLTQMFLLSNSLVTKDIPISSAFILFL